MELSQILQRLDYTISKAKELKPEQFVEPLFIKGFDTVLYQNFIGAFVGHYPAWKIQGFSYGKSSSFVHACLTVLPANSPDLFDELMLYYGLSRSFIKMLFYSHPFHKTILKAFLDSNKSCGVDLQSHIYKMEVIRKLLASGEITPMQEF